MTARLLASPSFHRAVQRVHKKVQELQHGKDSAEMGGVNIDEPNRPRFKRFLQYYVEELKEQLRGNSKK